MRKKLIVALFALASIGLMGASTAYAQKTTVAPPTATATRPATQSPNAAARSNLDVANAQAAAIVDAIQKDPALAGELSKNPGGGGALLKSRGVAGGGTVEIGPTTNSGAERTFTITITIKNVTIIITIRI